MSCQGQTQTPFSNPKVLRGRGCPGTPAPCLFLFLWYSRDILTFRKTHTRIQHKKRERRKAPPVPCVQEQRRQPGVSATSVSGAPLSKGLGLRFLLAAELPDPRRGISLDLPGMGLESAALSSYPCSVLHASGEWPAGLKSATEEPKDKQRGGGGGGRKERRAGSPPQPGRCAASQRRAGRPWHPPGLRGLPW